MIGTISDFAVQVWTFQMRELRWRFGAMGLLSGVVSGVIFSLALLMIVAAVLEHRILVWAISIVSFALAIAVMAIAAIFTLDFLQVRTSVSPTFRSALDIAALPAAAIFGLSIPATIGLGIGGWRSERSSRARMPGASRRKRYSLFYR